MINWKRILLVLFLVGGVTAFRYWSINQFNQVFDDLSDSYVASVSSVYRSYPPKQKLELASTSTEILVEDATSTDKTILEINSATTTGTTTPANATTSENLKLSFTFPQTGDEVYTGCTYPVTWQSSTTIDSLGIDLIDAGTREAVGPIASGLAKENIIDKEIQNLKWKVGVVWSGDYYIKASKINGFGTESRSNVFGINKMSENISAKEKEIICKGSGGLF